jgi:hypothetical protein
MGMGGQPHTATALPPGKTRYQFYMREGGWVPGPVWTGAEALAHTGIRSPDRPARSEWLFRLGYPGPRGIQYKQISKFLSASCLR